MFAKHSQRLSSFFIWNKFRWSYSQYRSIQFAIDYIQLQGGGRLVFDVGRFLSVSIHLKSNVTIHLLEGDRAVVVTLNPLDYDRNGLTALYYVMISKISPLQGKELLMGQGEIVARNVVALVHKGLIKDAFRNDRPKCR
jgi:polygalacturonase